MVRGDKTKKHEDKTIKLYLRVRFDYIVHDKLFKEGLSGAIWCQVFVLLLLPLLAPFLPFLSLLWDLSLFTLVPLHCLNRILFRKQLCVILHLWNIYFRGYIYRWNVLWNQNEIFTEYIHMIHNRESKVCENKIFAKFCHLRPNIFIIVGNLCLIWVNCDFLPSFPSVQWLLWIIFYLDHLCIC